MISCEKLRKDTAGIMDASAVLTGGNSGLSERYALVGNNQACHVYGPLNADMCQLTKYILNGSLFGHLSLNSLW